MSLQRRSLGCPDQMESTAYESDWAELLLLHDKWPIEGKVVDKFQKYRLLAKFPGLVGRRYKEKLGVLQAFKATQSRFRAACQDCTGMKCIDIGANVGDVTKVMAKFAGHVFAIEPDPVAFEHLSSQTRNLSNVTLINACAGVSSSTTRLYREKKFSSNPRLRTQGSSMYTASHLNLTESIDCEQIDVAEFIDGLDSEIGILKIDAEGAELPILESILEQDEIMNKIRYVFAETHERIWPEWHDRYEKVRRQAAGVTGSVIDLSWH